MNHIMIKELISGMYKGLKHLNRKKNPIEK
jgi:hypothetical protein